MSHMLSYMIPLMPCFTVDISHISLVYLFMWSWPIVSTVEPCDNKYI